MPAKSMSVAPIFTAASATGIVALAVAVIAGGIGLLVDGSRGLLGGLLAPSSLPSSSD